MTQQSLTPLRAQDFVTVATRSQYATTQQHMQHLMDDTSEHVNEKNDAHTAIHGPRRALERLRAMIWRVKP
jgi:hypothetical protein